MLRKSLIGAAAVLGLALVGGIASAQPASAHYGCGAWNNWCKPMSRVYSSYSFGWYGQHHWKRSYSYRNWNKGHVKRHHHAYKHKKGKHYR